MLELPEVKNISKQINESIIGKQIKCVLPPTKEHKFCWFNGDPRDYHEKLEGKEDVQSVEE